MPNLTFGACRVFGKLDIGYNKPRRNTKNGNRWFFYLYNDFFFFFRNILYGDTSVYLRSV